MISIDWNPTPRKLRQFAAASLVAGGVLAGFGRWPIVGLVFAAAGLLGLASPRLVRPLYLGLSVVTAPIGWVVSNLLLALIFLLVITPLGLLLRLTGRRGVLRRPAASTWERHSPPSSAGQYLRQY